MAWGCPVWGTGWYYPPYYGWGGSYPYYYRALPHLRVFRMVQPMERCIRAKRGGLWSLRRRRRRRSIQPADRNLRPRRGGIWPLWRARRRPGVQPRTGTYAQRVRDRTCMEAGVRRQCSAATIGPKPIATQPADGNTTRTIRTDEGGAVTRRGTMVVSSPLAAGGTSTLARTETHIEARTAVAEVQQRQMVEHRPAA